MPIARKKTQKKRLKKQKVETVIIIQETIKAEDKPFSEKMARGYSILRNIKLPDDL
jgi:hypothetical protein